MKHIKVIFICAAFLVTLSYLLAQTSNNPASNPRDNPDSLRPTQMAQPRMSPGGGVDPITTPSSATTPREGLSSVVPSPSATVAASPTPSNLDPVFTATPPLIRT